MSEREGFKGFKGHQPLCLLDVCCGGGLSDLLADLLQLCVEDLTVLGSDDRLDRSAHHLRGGGGW